MANGSDGSLIFDTELDNDGFEKGSDKLLSAVDNLAQQINQLGANMKASFSGITSILQSVSEAASRSATGVSDSSQKAAQAAENMSNAQSRAASAHAKAAQSAGNYDRQLASIQKQIDKAKEKLEPYYERLQRIHEFTDEALQYAQTDSQAGSVLDTEQEQIDALNAKYEERINVLKELEAEYARVAAARDAVDSAGPDGTETTDVPGGVEEMSGDEEAAASSTSNLNGVLLGLGRTMIFVSYHAMNLGKRIAQIGFNAISSGIKKAVSSLKSFSKQASKTTLTSNSLVKSLNSIRTMLVRRVKRMFISAIFSNVQEGIQRLAQFSSAFNKSMSSMKNAATQLSGNISIGIGNLLSTFEPVITRIISLVNAAITALNQLFALLRGKTTFTAAKKGADSFASAAGGAAGAAKKLMHELYSYDELTRQSDDSGGGGGGGGDTGIEYEELPIDLPEWIQDWVKRLKEAFENEQWYEVGQIIAEGINKGLEIVDDWINNKFRPWAVKWAGRIAEILNGVVDGLNWELLGKTFADGINAVFDAANTFLKKFNWENLGRGIGRAIKSWFDNIEWDLIGETFARKWNALIQTIKGIVTTPGIWESIGKSIGQFIKSWFTTIDIDSIATSAIAILNGITTAINNFLAQKPFEGLAQKISSAINRVIHEVDWGALGKSLSDLFKSVLNVIHDAVKEIDWHGVGRAIGEFLGSIDWAGIFAELADIIWTAFKGMLEGLMSTSGGRMFLGLMLALKTLPLAFTLTQGMWKIAIQRWIMTGVSPFESMPQIFAQVGGQVTGVLSKLIKGIGSALKTVASTIASYAGAIATSALAAFDAIMILYDVAKLKEAADTYNEALNAHKNETQTALSSYEKLYQEKGKAVADEWAKMVYNIDTTGMSMDEAQRALAAKVDSYWDDVPQNMWEGFKQGWNSYFGAGGSGLIGLISDAFHSLVDTVKSILGIHSPSTVFMQIGSDLVAGLLNGITTAWNAIVSFFTGALSALVSMLGTAWNTIKTTATTVWNAIKTGVTTTFTAMKTAITTAVQALSTALSTAWNAIKQAATTTWNAIKTGVTTAFNATKTAITTTVNTIQTTLSTAWQNISTAATNAWNTLKTNVTNAFNNTKTAVVNAANTLKSTLSSAWNSIKSTASSAWNSVKSTAVSTWTSLSNTVSSKWQSLKSSLGSVEWGSIGRNLVEGIKNGVGGAWQSLVNKVQSLAQGLINKVKGWFGVHSPSTVFAEIGEYLDAGLEQGIEWGSEDVLETVRNLADSVTNGLEIEASDVDMSGYGIVDGIEGILDKLSDLASTFQMIAEAITSIGGFKIPQIAEGTVVPYQAKAAANAAPVDDDADGVSSYLMSILTELQSLAEIVRTASNGQSVIKVLIDGREVFNAVVSENNRAIQRTGSSPIRV